jgi:hypothetical protein
MKKIILNKMEAKLTIITGPKNSGKTLRAKEMALEYKNDEVVWQQQPSEYVSRTLVYWAYIIKPNTKMVVIDDIDDEIFLYNLMLLYKYKKLAKLKINMVLVCEKNIDESKWVKNSRANGIDAWWLNLTPIKSI